MLSGLQARGVCSNFLYKTAAVSSGWYLRSVNILSGCYTDIVMNLSAQLRCLSSYIHMNCMYIAYSFCSVTVTPVTATTTSVVPPYHDMVISISYTWSYVCRRERLLKYALLVPIRWQNMHCRKSELYVVHSYTFKSKITTTGTVTLSELRGYSKYHSPFEIGDSFPVRLFVQV